MAEPITSPVCGYDALTVVSPMCFGNEEKNQDRARWFGPGNTGALGDGLTTSSGSSDAAGLVTDCSSVLFKEPIDDRLRVIADLLMARRMEALRSEVKLPEPVSPAMQEMLRQVTKAKLARSFQTTLVAVCLTPTDEMTVADVVCCGDSAFFAFSTDSGLLASSLSPDYGPEHDDLQASRTAGVNQSFRRICFQPGHELLVKIICDGANHPALMRKIGVKKGCESRWLFCRPLDLGRSPGACSPSTGNDRRAISLTLRDRLLVPKYLTGQLNAPPYRRYCRVPFSRMIRVMSPRAGKANAVTFDDRSSVTAALPDDFYTGNWTHYRDRFPRDAHFVLASDGFYRSFASPQALWSWLLEHRQALGRPAEQGALLANLHASLHTRSGDDDISFVWMFPRSFAAGENVHGENEKGAERAC